MDLRQIGLARSIHFRAVVEVDSDENFDLSFMEGRVAQRVVKKGRDLGLTLDAGDVVVEHTEAERDTGPITKPATIHTFEAWWKPETKEVVLRGGPGGGDVYTNERWPDAIVIAFQRTPEEAFLAGYVPPLETQTDKRALYRLDGWDEDERRWVYRQ